MNFGRRDENPPKTHPEDTTTIRGKISDSSGPNFRLVSKITELIKTTFYFIYHLSCPLNQKRPKQIDFLIKVLITKMRFVLLIFHLNHEGITNISLLTHVVMQTVL